jgi:hypothetical protein
MGFRFFTEWIWVAGVSAGLRDSHPTALAMSFILAGASRSRFAGRFTGQVTTRLTPKALTRQFLSRAPLTVLLPDFVFYVDAPDESIASRDDEYRALSRAERRS